ncbi:MAG: hypothetical protein JXR95_12795 [Deltaproteobacteria bacterium]|nr:hypothetical protein [Deltaproteobacteria bacterium]
MNQLFTSYAEKSDKILINLSVKQNYSLKGWSENFKLGTAGYRDLLDPEDFFSPDVPFNAVTMAVVCCARRNVALKHGVKSLHVGGEVRPHTQRFIDMFARIYAASGIEVFIRGDGPATTPIWLSSYGVFWHELDGGENFTASHSQSYKGGWKPMDSSGMQLLEMASEIEEEVKKIVKAIDDEPLEILMAPSNDSLIKSIFNPTVPYTRMLEKLISNEVLQTIRNSFMSGLKVAISTEGGSMGATARMIFEELRFPVDENGIVFLHEEENQQYHGIGILDGINHGVDPGKWQVYKNIGARELLGDGKADIVFIWDPDGDRFNIVTVAPKTFEDSAVDNSLEVDYLDENRILVYFKPNQIYFMLTALLMEKISSSDYFGEYDWVVATTYPTSKSIGEVALKIAAQNGGKISQIFVPVGFKYFGSMLDGFESALKSKNQEILFRDVTGKETFVGGNPRVLIMAEESGGASIGVRELMSSSKLNRSSLGLKEKDGMQIGVLTLALVSELFEGSVSMGEHYVQLLNTYDIKYRAYQRQDVTLYDESLKGEDRIKAQAQANERKNSIVNYFKSLISSPDEVEKLVRETGFEEFRNPVAIYYAGDGTYLEYENFWFELRASGTDAVLRYYMEGQDMETVNKLNSSLVNLSID